MITFKVDRFCHTAPIYSFIKVIPRIMEWLIWLKHLGKWSILCSSFWREWIVPGGLSSFCSSETLISGRWGLQGLGSSTCLVPGPRRSSLIWPTSFNHVLLHGLCWSARYTRENVCWETYSNLHNVILFSKRDRQLMSEYLEHYYLGKQLKFT